MILVCLLSYKRPIYLTQTIETFVKYNQPQIGPYLKMIALDQSASDDTIAVFEQFKHVFENLYITSKNLGIGWGYSQLVELSQLYHPDFILFLEDDWRCQAPLKKYLNDILQLFHTNPDIGTIRLRTINDVVATVNHVTMEPLKKERWRENLLVGNYHYVFNPHLVRTKVACALIPLASEHHAQLCYHALNLKAAQLIATMFVHIGEKRAPKRISRVSQPKPVISHNRVAETTEFVVSLPIEGDNRR